MIKDWVNSGQVQSYAYDQNGNMTSRTVDGMVWTYAYNAENQLITTHKNNQLIMEYGYDGDGKRVWAKDYEGYLPDNPRLTVYIGNYYEARVEGYRPPTGGDPVQPCIAPSFCVYFPLVVKSAVENVSYYYAGGQRIAMKKDGVVYYLYGDQLGSVSAVADGSGAMISRSLYEPWGVARYQTGSNITDYAYTGQMREGDVYFYNARWPKVPATQWRGYDPQLGRFMQADTFVPTSQGTQGFDRFAYVNNNPINSSDPSGHCIGFLFSICLGVLTENALVQFYVQNNSNLNNQVRDKIGGNLVTSLSDVITSESARTGISSELIGSIIRHESGAFERRLFFNGLMADTAEFGEATIRSLFKKGSASIGIGQMQVTLAISLEKMGYVDPKGGGTIINLLNHKKTVGYIAGNLKYLQDNLSKDFGPEFTSLPKDIRNRLLLIGYNVGYQELKKNLIERSAYDYVIRESYDNQTLDRYRSWRIR